MKTRMELAWWLSSNADKARDERWLLLQSPLWMAAVGFVMLTGRIPTMTDASLTLFGVGVSLPAVLVPWWAARRDPRRAPGVPYWVKLNLWSAILVAFGTYFGTAYFFDLMGMRYDFAVEWTFNARVVGRTPGEVPVFMYPLTQAYFVTYFVVLTVAWRGLRRWLGPSRWVSVGTLLVVAFTIAFAETFLMASDALAGVFGYADRSRMLALGSWGYAIYFVVGVPMLAPVDERGAGDWPLSRVFMTACAACMLILVGLEIWAQLVGPL